MKKITLSKLHLWWGVILALPALLVGITCILIAHDHALGTKKITLPASLAPSEKMGKEKLLPRAWLKSSDGSVWLAGKYGVMRWNGQQEIATGLPALDAQSILEVTPAVLIGAKQGLWRVENQQATLLAKDEFWQLSRTANEIYAVGKKQIWFSNDQGRSFKPCADCASALQAWAEHAAQPENKAYTLDKLVIDLHTGKFFFGKKGEWVWIDILGITLIVLTLTGLILWVRRERQRKALAA
jgi:hypothetical protein